MIITKDTLIKDIVDSKVNAIQILMGNGMGCIGCPSSQFETLEQACEIHGLSVEKLLDELNQN
ncbi:MAG: DUF1858 domain-containing protein [Cetobacterium sp.]|uniref:DUF1858 domain-containing protein n=1 Tax=Cetobacterium sp. TaxID=2071632 RepID=UPI003F3CF858